MVQGTVASRTGLQIRRVAGHIGADVNGIDLSVPLATETIAEIRAALHKHKVLFFRDQRLDHAAHIAFAGQFGELTRGHPHDIGAVTEFPEILTIDPKPREESHGRNYEERYRRRRTSYLSGWHTDVTAAVNPPAASVLRAEVVPEFGGDTHWTNLVAAYEGLSEPLRALAEGLTAEHRFLAGFQMLDNDPEVEEILRQTNSDPLVAVHPVVRVIPETGERALFVNPSSTSRILGLTTAESRALLDLFFEQIARAEYTVRFRWAPGSVAFWDNRTTAHLAAVDVGHLDARRTLYRVTLLGDRPVGVNGFVSTAVAGRPFAAVDRRVRG
jgi:alkyl sulfatase